MNTLYDFDKPDNVKKFMQITREMVELYENKNHDYGDSFGKSVDKYGNISALTRISDKFNRLEQLILNDEQKVSDERIEDTLMDLASYSIMFLIALGYEAKDFYYINEITGTVEGSEFTVRDGNKKTVVKLNKNRMTFEPEDGFNYEPVYDEY